MAVRAPKLIINEGHGRKATIASSDYVAFVWQPNTPPEELYFACEASREQLLSAALFLLSLLADDTTLEDERQFFAAALRATASVISPEGGD